MNQLRVTPPVGWHLHDDEGFIGLVGPVWERRTGDTLVLAFTAGDKHANQRGMVQGGMLMTLADRVMGHVLRVGLAGQPVATVQLDTQFLAAAHIDDFIEARGRVVRITQSIAFVEGEVSRGTDLLMRASGIWKRLRDSDGAAAEQFSQRFGSRCP